MEDPRPVKVVELLPDLEAGLDACGKTLRVLVEEVERLNDCVSTPCKPVLEAAEKDVDSSPRAVVVVRRLNFLSRELEDLLEHLVMVSGLYLGQRPKTSQ